MFVSTGIPGCVMAWNPLHPGIFCSSRDCTRLQAMKGSERRSSIHAGGEEPAVTSEPGADNFPGKAR